MTTTGVWNFGAGPATMPKSVLKKAQTDLLNYKNTGMSVMEISHRSKEYEKLNNEAQKNLRDLLEIPENYKILFMQGGGHTQFSAVVLNLLVVKRRQFEDSTEGGKEEFNPPLDYLVTGSWSQKAVEEAKKLYNNVNVALDVKKLRGSYGSIPPQEEWKLSGPSAAYVYYCDNETVNGVEFNHVPDIDPSVPLVCDMSSNLLSRKVNISKFGMIYAGAQKNIGPAGVTVVIVREDLLATPKPSVDVPAVPSMLSYKVLADHNSLYNTPPVFAIYMSDLVFEWLLENGGIEAIEKVNFIKASRLYDCIKNSKIYRSPIEESVRSRMNVPFRIEPEELEKEFLKGAEELGMVQLKGHRSVGGIRASIYNAMPLEGVDTLIKYMQEFEKKHS
ncbi:9443_t:CDS:1 [Acaulospora morrowiae]|uniref:Phosphoserine aminotransferase n=1 Tax=Acaulospora morrowiae TaxID=94023 RepID=A0A9N8V966_9GLOM|nr:9443_t:CDS:1 [Acaulospora morrowiae]